MLKFTLLLATTWASLAQETGNVIQKADFNFGHQSGYLYSRMDDAYFHKRGEWFFEAGAAGYYTAQMPRVRNPHWRERLLAQAPLGIEIAPSDNMAIQFNSDLVAEFPHRDIHSVGGNAPRFRFKMKILDEGPLRPAGAFTVGVTLSSAKPYNIWDKNHNYDESNGLAGPGTGVADYLLLFTLSKRVNEKNAFHTRLGLLPLGSPVEYVRGSGQADEIPYGLGWERRLSKRWSLKAETAGMYNLLSSTELAHYSVARTAFARESGRLRATLNLEKGLTEETDDWVAALYFRIALNQPGPR